MSSSDRQKVKVVWIDLDDTLIDFHANSRAALSRLYTLEGFDRLWPSPEAWIEAYEGHNIPLWVDYSVGNISTATLRLERFRRPLTDAGMPDAEALAIAPRLDPLYLDLLAEERRLIPGATELLDALRARGLMVGVLSNGFAEVQYRKIARAGLTDKIDRVVLSDDIGITKPDTRLFRHAQTLTPYPHTPGAHLMIGDNPATDIGGALAAGWKAIWFNRHNLPDIPRGAMAVNALVSTLPIVDALR